MKKFTFIIMFALLPMWLWGQTNQYFYYSSSGKHSLELNTEYAFMSVTHSVVPLSIPGATVGILEKDNSLNTSHVANERYWTEVKLPQATDARSYFDKLSQLKTKGNNAIVAPCFTTPSGKRVSLSNYFYVKLHSVDDLAILEKKAIETKTEIVRANEFMPQWYLLSVTPNAGRNALEIANYMFETGLFECAQPNFIEEAEPSAKVNAQEVGMLPKSTKSCANDPYYPQQWGLDVINACRIWKRPTGTVVRDMLYTRGAGTVVAVIDEGIQGTHPDLAANMHSLSFDAETGTTPSKLYSRSYRGTAIAGIIGAVRNNSIGVAGVAPECQLMSVSLQVNKIWTPEKAANGILWAYQNGADVINCSFEINTHSQVLEDAVKQAVTYGRKGLGTVIVAMLGENTRNFSTYPGLFEDVIAVGAIEKNSRGQLERHLYSPSHLNLSVVAPGSNIYTTYSGNGYISNFGGPTAATAFVSGVAALVISNTPTATVNVVRDKIEKSAQKIRTDIYNYGTHPSKPNGTWSGDLGYGMVDAERAASAYGGPYIPNLVIEHNATKPLSIGSLVTFIFTKGSVLEIQASSNLMPLSGQSGPNHQQYLAIANGLATVRVKTIPGQIRWPNPGPIEIWKECSVWVGPPAYKGTVKVKTSERTSIVRIYSVNGTMVYNASTDGNFNIYDTNLQNGVYIIETIDAQGESIREKVMLRR